VRTGCCWTNSRPDVATWFEEVADGGTGLVHRPDSWRGVTIALERAGTDGIVLILPDGQHAPAVLRFGEDRRVWRIRFGPGDPAAEPVEVDALAAVPAGRIMALNKCSVVLNLAAR